MTQHKLHAHAYSGRESGLMLIGDAEALKKLGQDLQAAAELPRSEAGYHWPRQVAVLNASSPYADRESYRITVHLQTAALPEALMKKPRSGASTTVFLITAILALAGAISLPVWLWKAL